MMNNLSKNISTLISKASIFTLSIFSIYIFIMVAYIENGPGESVDIQPRSLLGLFLNILMASFILIFIKIFSRINPKILFATLSIIYFIIGSILFTSYPGILRDDSAQVYRDALKIHNNIYDTFKPGGYAYDQPHQTGIIILFFLLSSISNSVVFFHYVFLFMSIGSIFIIWKVLELYTKNKKIHSILILLNFIFLPNIFFSMFIYNSVPGLFFSLLGLLVILKGMENSKAPSKMNRIIAGSLLISIGVFIRNNFIILALALSISVFIRIIQILRKNQPLQRRLILQHYLTVSLLFLLPLLLPTLTYHSFLALNGLHKNPNPIPKSAWIAMSIQNENNDGRVPGWYYGTYMFNIKNSTKHPQELDGIYKKEIYSKLKFYIKNPKYFIKFLHNKTISAWLEPTFQSIWSGPTFSNQNSSLKIYTKGSKIYRLVRFFLGATLFIIYTSATISLLLYNKKSKAKLSGINQPVMLLFNMTSLYFIGGVFFHSFWEIKSQYLHPYVFMLTPICAIGINYIFVFIGKYIKLRKHNLGILV